MTICSRTAAGTATSWPVIQQVLRARNLAKLEHENQQALLQQEEQLAAVADADTNLSATAGTVCSSFAASPGPLDFAAWHSLAVTG